MAKIITYPKNILEDNTVTVTPVENASFPAYRLYDRILGRLFKFSAADNPSIVHVDQGATGNIAIDSVIIPAGHNLDGLTITMQFSTDNIAWSTAKSWAQSGAGAICESFGTATKRYWRMSIASPAAAVEMGELFFTQSYTWARNPVSLDRKMSTKYNVERLMDRSGHPRYIEHGTEKRYRAYFLEKITGSHRTEIESVDDVWAGKNPFWMKDTDGDLMFGELISPIDFSRSGSFADSPFEFLEIPD
jgi:hypothetical protein